MVKPRATPLNVEPKMQLIDTCSAAVFSVSGFPTYQHCSVLLFLRVFYETPTVPDAIQTAISRCCTLLAQIILLVWSLLGLKG